MEEHLNQAMKEHLELSTLQITLLQGQVMTTKHLLTMILKETLNGCCTYAVTDMNTFSVVMVT